MRLAIDAVRFAHHILWVIRGLPKKRGQRPYSLQTEMFSDPFCESTDGCAPPFSDGSRSPQRTEERADFFRQELRLFHGSEVPALGHRRPPFDIEHPLDPRAWRRRKLGRKQRHAKGGFYAFSFIEFERLAAVLFVDAQSGCDVAAKPVNRYVSEQLVQSESTLNLPIAGPVGCGKPKAHRIVRVSGLIRLAIDAVRFAHHILWVWHLRVRLKRINDAGNTQ